MKLPRPEEPAVRLVLTIKKSAWGFTAYHPNGVAVAHAKNRAWLEAYVKDSS